MLSLVPIYVDHMDTAHPMFDDSVLDLASDDKFPCRRVVAHRYAQELLDRYWHGNYPGSSSAFPRDPFAERRLMTGSSMSP